MNNLTKILVFISLFTMIIMFTGVASGAVTAYGTQWG